MTPEILLERFGYLAVLVGTFLEGETILVLAGFFAERGFLYLPLVIGVAFCGAFFGHLFWFWIGRTRGVQILNRYPKINRHMGRGIRLFERYGAPAIVLSQYLYGLRITCAIIVGLSRISMIKFVIYEAISCITWATLVAVLGFYFGKAVETVLGKAQNIEKYGLVVLLLIAGGIFIYHRIRERREAEASDER